MHAAIPLFLFALFAVGIAVGMLGLGILVGPSRSGAVKEMPYESGMDPLHDTRRRFDVRFHLVAIAFLLFDVELLFIYPWAVASRNPRGIDWAIDGGWISSREMVLCGVFMFLALVIVGLIYEWRKGVLKWR